MGSTEMASVFKVLACRKRLEIVTMLLAQKLCVGAIAERLSASQSSVSQHLRVLRTANLVTDSRDGFHIHYDVNRELLCNVADGLLAMLATKNEEPECLGKGSPCAEKNTTVNIRKG